MENNGPIIVGLDIGTTKISVMIGREDQFGKLEILGMGKAISGGVLRGIVANIDKTVPSSFNLKWFSFKEPPKWKRAPQQSDFDN